MGLFWAATLGYPEPDIEGWLDFLRGRGIPEVDVNATCALEDPEGVLARLFFQRVPEPKTVKNRVHLDLDPAGDNDRAERIEDEVQRLLGIGAGVVNRVTVEDGDWVVMADPEGNEFCVD